MIAPLSLREKFLLTIVAGAVIPLAVVGVWLTRATASAGEELLRTELRSSLLAVTTTMRERWAVREGDLLLLARNAVIRDALAKPPGDKLAADDSAYLETLASDVRATFPAVEYRDNSGHLRWRFDEEQSDARRPAGPTVAVSTPITGDGGESLGTLQARVAVAALIPHDSLALGIANSSLTIVERGTSRPLIVKSPAGQSFVVLDSARMLRVSDTLTSPPLIAGLAAPLAPYVAPFAGAARRGLAVLMLVALGALILAALFAARAAGALRRVADAADAVTAGDLQRSVSWSGRDEIGRLATAFNTMTDSLRRTLGELAERRALAAVGEFAASLSHEVRNALTAVRIDLQHAQRRLPDDGKEQELVGRALANVRRLDGVVTGALRAAKGGTVERVPVDVHEAVISAVRDAEPSFAITGARIVVESAGRSSASTLGNAAALEQLFLNLLLNAAEALPSGGQASIRVDVENCQIKISVADTGIGMSTTALQRAGREIHSSKPNGTGLGLRIANRIAAAHGGELRLASEEGRGTTATVLLPAHCD